MSRAGARSLLSRRSALMLLGVGASLVFLWLSLRDIEFDAIGRALARANFSLALPFLIALFAFYWLKSLRWRDLLRPSRRLTGSSLFPIVMAGYAGTAVLPLQMGELLRTWICARRFDIPVATVLGSIAIERVFDLLVVLALLGFVLVNGGIVPPLFVSAGYAIAVACVATMAMATAFLLWRDAAMRVSASLLSWLPDDAREWTMRHLQWLADSLEAVGETRNAVRIAWSSVFQWLLMGGCVACSLYALDIQVPPTGVFLVLVATVLGISLPTSPGYVGNIQLAYTLALAPYDVDPASAFAASVFYHALAYGAVVVVGFACLSRMGYSLRDIRKSAAGEGIGPGPGA